MIHSVGIFLILLACLKDDAIQWVLEGAPPGEASDTVQMVNMILFLNFAAIHTTSLVCTLNLYPWAYLDLGALFGPNSNSR